MRRRRIDWDEEIKKTERIRWKGLRFSIAAFGLAAFWIFGVSRMGRKDISLTPITVLLFFVGAGTLLFIMLMRRKQK